MAELGLNSISLAFGGLKVNRVAVVGPRGGVGDDRVCPLERLVAELDVLALVVRLPAAHVALELGGPGVDARLELR